jgi:hypothetical protein
MFSLICAVAACHEAKRPIVRVEVFEDHVSVDGVRSDLPIQRVVDAQTQNHRAFVMLIPQQPLSTERLNELNRSEEKMHPNIGIRRVQLECLASASSACR